jgi:hypothetical protein
LARYRRHASSDTSINWKASKRKHAQYILGLRILAEQALRHGILVPSELTEAMESWSTSMKSRLLIASASRHASPQLQAVARDILTRFPDLLYSGGAARSVRVAGRFRSSLLGYIEDAYRLQGLWWPS